MEISSRATGPSRQRERSSTTTCGDGSLDRATLRSSCAVAHTPSSSSPRWRESASRNPSRYKRTRAARRTRIDSPTLSWGATGAGASWTAGTERASCGTEGMGGGAFPAPDGSGTTFAGGIARPVKGRPEWWPVTLFLAAATGVKDAILLRMPCSPARGAHSFFPDGGGAGCLNLAHAG